MRASVLRVVSFARLAALLVLAGVSSLGLAACASSTSSGRGSFAPPASPPPDLGRACQRAVPVSVSLVGIDPTVRKRLSDAVARGFVPALHVETKACNLDVEVLACGRPVSLVDVPASTLGPQPIEARWLRGKLPGSNLAGVGWLLPSAPQAVDAIKLSSHTTRLVTLDFQSDLANAHPELRWPDATFEAQHGAPLGTFAPALDASELVGNDCARATHRWSTASLGRFTVQALVADTGGKAPAPRTVDQSACQTDGCAEAIAVSLYPLARTCPAGQVAASPGACSRPSKAPAWLPAAGQCPAPVAGQRSEEATRGVRLLAAGKYREAAPVLFRVASGATSDDAGNRQHAALEWAIAAQHDGQVAESNGVLDQIAKDACHLDRNHAVAFNALLARRGEH